MHIELASHLIYIARYYIRERFAGIPNTAWTRRANFEGLKVAVIKETVWPSFTVLVQIPLTDARITWITARRYKCPRAGI